MTRVMILTPSYPSPDNREAGIFIHRQVLGLVRHGFDCQVVHYRAAAPPFPAALLRRAYYRHKWHRIGRDQIVDAVPVKTVLFRAPPNGADVVPAIAEAVGNSLGSELRRTDVIYAQWLWHAGAAAILLRERFGCPVVAIGRGSDLHEWLHKHPTSRAWVEGVLAQADRSLTNCQALKDRAHALCPTASIDVVYNGCDTDRFRPSESRLKRRRALGISDDQRVLVFCGSVDTRKGAAELTVAWSRFAARYPAWRLLVVGTPVDRILARRLGAEPRVDMLGRVSEGRVAAILQAADGYVQPSRAEGLANATMEAMATGLPVITTDADGQREVVEDGQNGWLVRAGDVESLVSALQALADDPEEGWRRGRAARRTIEECFPVDTQLQRLAGILQRAAVGSQSASRARP